MHCVIMAAGRGTRMQPLTNTTPKPLISVAGKPILDHIAAALPADITELILIVNYLSEQIQDHCGDEFFGRPVTYVTQENPAGGTGAAVLCAKPHITDTFLILNGDDIIGAAGLKALVHETHAMSYHTSDHPEDFGVIIENEDSALHSIEEKPTNPTSNKVNINSFMLTPAIFNFETQADNSLGEVLLTDMIATYNQHHPITLIEQELWLPLGRPEDIPIAEAALATKV